MAKRPLEEISVSDINDELIEANGKKEVGLCGVITQLSPVKHSKRNSRVSYFDGKMSDGTKSMRLVCFNSKLHGEIEKAKVNKESVGFTNCEIKRTNRGDDEYEVLMTGSSKMFKSSTLYDVDHHELDPENVIDVQIDEIVGDLIVDNQHVSVVAKVMRVDSPEIITTKADQRIITKQECCIADASNKCRLVLWEEDVKRVIVGKSYKFSNATVKSYDGSKYLSLSKKSELVLVDDINVGDFQVKEADGMRSFDGDIISIISFESYKICNTCFHGKVTNLSAVMGKCGKCSAAVKLSRCEDKSVMKVMLESSDGTKVSAVLSGNEILKKVAQVEELRNIEEDLLSSPRAVYELNGEEIINVKR
jgi:hypothetical protein